MAAQRIALEGGAIDDCGHQDLAVVGQTERRDGARLDTEMAAQPIRAAEREVAGVEDPGERLQIDRAILLCHHQPHPPLLVAEEEVFEVGPLDAAVELGRWAQVQLGHAFVTLLLRAGA
jgi:hypothetical protein